MVATVQTWANFVFQMGVVKPKIWVLRYWGAGEKKLTNIANGVCDAFPIHVLLHFCSLSIVSISPGHSQGSPWAQASSAICHRLKVASMWQWAVCHSVKVVRMWQWAICHSVKVASMWLWALCHSVKVAGLWQWALCHNVKAASMWQWACTILLRKGLNGASCLGIQVWKYTGKLKLRDYRNVKRDDILATRLEYFLFFFFYKDSSASFVAGEGCHFKKEKKKKAFQSITLLWCLVSMFRNPLWMMCTMFLPECPHWIFPLFLCQTSMGKCRAKNSCSLM